MAQVTEVTSVHDLGKQVCEALSIPVELTSRVVIDIDMENMIPLVYVKMVGSKQLLDVDWTQLTGAKVTVLDKAN